jgi:hypothetical protein
MFYLVDALAARLFSSSFIAFSTRGVNLFSLANNFRSSIMNLAIENAFNKLGNLRGVVVSASNILIVIANKFLLLLSDHHLQATNFSRLIIGLHASLEKKPITQEHLKHHLGQFRQLLFQLLFAISNNSHEIEGDFARSLTKTTG